MKFNKKIVVSSIVTILSVITIYTAYRFLETKGTQAPVISDDITSITFKPSDGHIFLLYPYLNIWEKKDGAEDTYLVEIDREGKVIKEEVIQDPDFGPISLDQKTTRPDTLFASLNSAQYANHFYTFNLNTKQFQKERITYFEHDVMLDSVSHQGEDTWFKSIVSHETGTQTYVEGLGMSTTISNVEEQKVYLTPPEYLPTPSPLLETRNQIAYVSAGDESTDGEEAAMVFLDRVTGEAKVYRGEEDPYEYTALHTDGVNTYFADSLGNMHQIDATGKNTEKHYKVIENAYYNAHDAIRMINENEGYQVVMKYNPETSTEERMMVKWTFGKDFSVEKMDLPYWNDNNLYRYLYHDPILKRSYLVELDAEEETETGRLLIVDEQLKLINSIRIEDPLGLDFVAE